MKTKLIITATFLSLLLAACGGQATPSEPTPDVAAVRTSAASTVVSQFTLTAAVFTPTASLPTETSAPKPPQPRLNLPLLKSQTRKGPQSPYATASATIR